jgi:hypothetical protein
MTAAVVCLLAVVAHEQPALAQNPVQWYGNARAAIDRAHEQSLPLMFWVSESFEPGDDDDLRDAQEASFRDPTVVAFSRERYIPVRVARNSRMLEEAEKLGLPKAYGLYIALITSDGRVLDQIDPGQVATPEALAERLAAAFRRYRDELYHEKLGPLIADLQAPKPEVRKAVQTVWRLGILIADRDVIALLQRPDLTPVERKRLYGLLGTLATDSCVDTLLTLAAQGDRDAAAALARAETGALERLLSELPQPGPDAPTERQLAAYAAAARIARMSTPRPSSFWATASPETHTEELDKLRRRAEAVLAYWQEESGRWR